MEQVIIWKSPYTGFLALTRKGKKTTKTINEVAKACVCKGIPYKIVNESDLPSDITFIDAWQFDFTGITDVGENEECPSV